MQNSSPKSIPWGTGNIQEQAHEQQHECRQRQMEYNDWTRSEGKTQTKYIVTDEQMRNR